MTTFLIGLVAVLSVALCAALWVIYCALTAIPDLWR